MSTLTDWRTQRRTTLTLPSGLEAELRRIAVEDLAARGDIPAPLYAQVTALIAGAAPALDLASFPDHAKMIDLVASAALVSPAVAEVADETHITMDELPFADRIAIFNWAQGGAAALAPFPGAASRDGADDPPAGDRVPRAAQRSTPPRLA